MNQNPWSEKFSVQYPKPNLAENQQPSKKYIIAFTPRSGSTWLNDILISTYKIGKPKEWFNSKFIKVNNRIEAYNSNSIEDYYMGLKADKKTGNGVFGLELTWFQANLVFEHMGKNTLFDDVKNWFWLKRKDFVSQGISLYKAVESGKFHSIDGKSNHIIEYNSEKIRHWILHILQQEYFFNEFFKQKNIIPSELWYEEMMENKEETIYGMFNELNIKNNKPIDFSKDSRYNKIADEQTEMLISKFISEEDEFVNYWENNRKYKNVTDFLAEGI